MHVVSHQQRNCTYMERHTRFPRFCFTTWHPVPVWYTDPAVGPSHLAPCSHLVVQTCHQPCAGAAGGTPGTLLAFDAMWTIYSNSCYPTVLNLRANHSSLARRCYSPVSRMIFSPSVWVRQWPLFAHVECTTRAHDTRDGGMNVR